MFTLIGVGVGTAYVYSAIATVFPGLFPDSFKHHGQIDLYFESAAVITVLVLFEKVPTDALIQEGSSSIDQSIITGEPTPG